MPYEMDGVHDDDGSTTQVPPLVLLVPLTRKHGVFNRHTNGW